MPVPVRTSSGSKRFRFAPVPVRTGSGPYQFRFGLVRFGLCTSPVSVRCQFRFEPVQVPTRFRFQCGRFQRFRFGAKKLEFLNCKSVGIAASSSAFVEFATKRPANGTASLIVIPDGIQWSKNSSTLRFPTRPEIARVELIVARA